MSGNNNSIDVAVIGAGPAGLAAAIAAREVGASNVTIFERAENLEVCCSSVYITASVCINSRRT